MENRSEKLLGSIVISPKMADEVKKSVKNNFSFGNKIKKYLTDNTTNLFEVILMGAISLSASDIHLEPQKDNARLRIRIDGMLQDVCFFENNVYENLLSRIKLISKLKLNIEKAPQDGRFTVFTDEKSFVEIRTSSLPAEYGESIVMRILNPKSLTFEDLDLRKDLYEIFLREIKKPNGLIIVTGPTSAGKTTTLYAFLMKIQRPEIKIITIEDPIEYHLPGISQTQVSENSEYNFAQGLRSIVRQNPDIILVGEIRDLETAAVALQASLTGHLVFSTMHTNNAPGTIARLIDLGVSASTISQALKMSIAKRLIRRVCPECSSLIKPSAAQLAEIEKGLKGVPSELGVPKNFQNLKIPKAAEKGCEKCNNLGYKGRKGLYEVFLLDEKIQKAILTGAAMSDLKNLAIKNGMITMYQSGLLEVVAGVTTLEEIKRVVEQD